MSGAQLFQLGAIPTVGWLTLFEAIGERPAVRVRMAPIGPSASRAAVLALRQSDHPIEDYAADAGFDAYSRELCRRSLIEWDGVGADGELAPLTSDNIDRFLADPRVLGRLQVEFVFPFLEREGEKNGSAPSSGGTSPATTGAKVTAAVAQPAAKPARTPSARRKPAKARRSGK